MHQNKSINWILQSKSFYYLHQNHSITCTKTILSPAPKPFFHLHQNHSFTCTKIILLPAPNPFFNLHQNHSFTCNKTNLSPALKPANQLHQNHFTVTSTKPQNQKNSLKCIYEQQYVYVNTTKSLMPIAMYQSGLWIRINFMRIRIQKFF